jgi:site-specific DNA-adenine methylase
VDEHFYETNYEKFNINVVSSRRSINSDGSKRGKINEVLLNNFQL